MTVKGIEDADTRSSASPDHIHFLTDRGTAKYERPAKVAGSKAKRIEGFGGMTSPVPPDQPGRRAEGRHWDGFAAAAHAWLQRGFRPAR